MNETQTWGRICVIGGTEGRGDKFIWVVTETERKMVWNVNEF
jgi:hypothetical protein